jgi:NTE family protein
VAASALIPQGRVEHRMLAAFLTAIVDASTLNDPDALHPWPQKPTWIVAVDYGSGRRVAFGRAGAPPAPLPDAVVASCSIPGWYAPKVVAGRRYVDGGVRSVTSVDLLRSERLDEVYVLAPMASHQVDHPWHPWLRTERFIRQMFAMALDREVRAVRASGTQAVVLTPGPEDLAAIGINLMDGRRSRRVLETSLRTTPTQLNGEGRRPVTWLFSHARPAVPQLRQSVAAG